MGDRGNIIVEDGKSKVYLYTHWGGSELKEILMSALKRGKERWTDGQYLARIIFCEMVKGDEKGLTGFGISSEIGGGGTDIVVDVERQEVDGVSFSKFIGEKELKGETNGKTCM